MKNRNLTYRCIANLISIVYLNFFFISPFFHVHSDDGRLSNGNSEMHSHFVSDILDESDHAESDHHIEDGNEHRHLFKPNYVNVIAPGRHLLVFSVLPIPGHVISELSSNKEHKTQFIVISSLSSKALWERYVQSASNNSPPQA